MSQSIYSGMPEQKGQMKYPDELVFQVLADRFGFSSFLPAQHRVIRQLLDGKSTFAIMPTGSGKSLCFQLPALIFEGLCLVVSPMISLMKDQVMQMAQLGISARMYNSMMSSAEQAIVLQELAMKKIKLLYAAPETLLKEWFLEQLDSAKISLIVIDEAHCISMWGHDFRQEYRQLASLRQRYLQAVCFALTATAIPKVRSDIRDILAIPKENEVLESFDRPNLLLVVEAKKNSFNRLLSFLNSHANESGIIYCMTRKTVDTLSDKLQSEGYTALPYHAGLSDAERHHNQEAFIRDEVKLMVATIAFGMGINKSNVRFVIHFDLPKSPETYYQEIGRAGRDGLPSTCLLFYSRGDIILLKKIIMNHEDEELNRRAKEHLDAMLSYCETYGCRRIPILSWFGESYPQPNCKMCDNCLSHDSEKIDASLEAQKFLSAVYRGQEAFGAEQIIKILRGSRAKEIIAAGADKLSVYGIGKQWSSSQWYSLFLALKRERALSEGYPNFRLVLNELSWAILRKQSSFSMPRSMLALMLEPAKGDSDDELFELLSICRRKIAEERKVPPYVIFSDKSLREMATYYPQSDTAFAAINGVGSYKVKEFGSLFVSVIRNYCQERGIDAVTIPPVSQNKGKSLTPSKTEQVADYVKSGHSLQQSMLQFGVQLSTIIEHLQRYLEADGWIDPALIKGTTELQSQDFSRIENSFAELGLERLAPVFTALNEEFSYLELKLVRLYMLAKIKEDFSLMQDNY